MTSRHLAGFVAAVLLSTPAVRADDPAAALTPAQALARLKAGNARFAANSPDPRPIDAAQRQALVAGERPFAMVLSCADSRVPPEFIFNAALGELFVVRSVGQAVDRAVLASLEYGAGALKAPLLVVMGHDSCDVVKAAMAPPAPPIGTHLAHVLKQITPAPVGEDERDAVKTAVLGQIEQVVNDVMGQSDTLQRAVTAGHLQIVGGYYDMASGRVMFSQPLEPVPTVSEKGSR